MNYQRIYNELIEKFQTNPILKSDEIYTEEHHIIPKCMGGTNDKENLVRLPAREHIMAHLLLKEVYPDNRKIVFATNAMLMSPIKNNKNQGVREMAVKTFSTKTVSSIREAKGRAMRGEGNPMYGKIGELSPGYGRIGTMTGRKHSEESKKKMSEARQGEKHPWYGRHHTEETKKKLSIANKGRKLSKEVRQRMSDRVKGENHPLYGKSHSEEAKERMRKAKLGKHASEETKRKMSEARKGEKSPSSKRVQDPDGNIYNTINLAATKMGVCKDTIRHWIRNKPEKGWIYLDDTKISTISEDTRLKLSKASKGKNNPRAKKVQGPDNTVYDTLQEAADLNKLHRDTIFNWIKNKPEKGFKYL